MTQRFEHAVRITYEAIAADLGELAAEDIVDVVLGTDYTSQYGGLNEEELTEWHSFLKAMSYKELTEFGARALSGYL